MRSHIHAASSICIETLEARQLRSVAVESVDGTNNNLAKTTWGSAGIDLIRLTAAAYADGVSSAALPNDASARTVSNLLNSQSISNTSTTDRATTDGNSLSDFGYAFGQFMDHDLDLTPDGGASLPIAVAVDDPIGPDALPFTRSMTDPSTGSSTSNPAQQVTTVTSFLDLSQVYGSSQPVSDALRTFNHGLMKTSPGYMLPYDNTTYFTPAQIASLNMANDSQAAPESDLFATGDRRGNENIELTALQTLFVRNHNRIAAELLKNHPRWMDEQLYQEARKLNIAEYQNIVYTGWIPAVLGSNALAKYSGYKSNVNATISNEFSTVAFRFGHSLLSAQIERHNNDATDIADATGDADIALSEDFFDPYLLNPKGVVDPLTGHTSSDIGAILKGEADGVSQANDLLAVNDVRNLLFGNGGFGGEDLMARDVQRDRDNGIADYNLLRGEMGLPRIVSFAQISTDPAVQKEFAQAYPGGVNTIDAFEGGLAEEHVRGSDVGPLFQAIMVDQFTRLRDGDRFFYLNQNFNNEEHAIMDRGMTLTNVIEANTMATNLQQNAFVFSASIGGRVFRNSGQPQEFGNSPSNFKLQLLDSDGVVVASTTADRSGDYRFNQLSGPSTDASVGAGVSATGTFTVVLVAPQSPPVSSARIAITHGDSEVQNVNLIAPPPVISTNPRPQGLLSMLDQEERIGHLRLMLNNQVS